MHNLQEQKLNVCDITTVFQKRSKKEKITCIIKKLEQSGKTNPRKIKFKRRLEFSITVGYCSLTMPLVKLNAPFDVIIRICKGYW